MDVRPNSWESMSMNGLFIVPKLGSNAVGVGDIFFKAILERIAIGNLFLYPFVL